MGCKMIPLKDRMDLQRRKSFIWEQMVAFVDSGGGALQFVRDTRTQAQNKKLWPLLQDFADQISWAGAKRTKEEWKDLLMSAYRMETYKEQPRILPGLFGEVVSFGKSTSKLSKRDFCGLIEFIYAQGAEMGVRWSEPALAAYDSYREAA